MTEMSNVAAKTVLDAFINDLDRVSQLLKLIHVFREFAGQQESPSDNAHELWTTAQEVRTDLPVLSGSLLLYLCGRFDFFVRGLVGTVVDDLVDKAEKYEDLPPLLRKEYLTRTLAINETPAKYNHTPESAMILAAELAGNLSGNSDSNTLLRIDATAITFTETNMRPRMVIDIFKRVGISNVWETLGMQLPLRRHFEVASPVECKNLASARLEDIMKERNDVAHPTADTSFPGPEKVEGMAEFFRVLAGELTELATAPRSS